jgi:hypothetical protein
MERPSICQIPIQIKWEVIVILSNHVLVNVIKTYTHLSNRKMSNKIIQSKPPFLAPNHLILNTSVPHAKPSSTAPPPAPALLPPPTKQLHQNSANAANSNAYVLRIVPVGSPANVAPNFDHIRSVPVEINVNVGRTAGVMLGAVVAPNTAIKYPNILAKQLSNADVL